MSEGTFRSLTCREVLNIKLATESPQTVCQVKGILVNLKFNTSFVTYTIDDSTALLDIAWPYMTVQRSPIPIATIPTSPHGTLVAPTSLQIGSFLVVRGLARSYRGRIELKASWIHIDKDPNAETVHLLELCTRDLP